jgi:CRP/FNR family transcriptional regulator
MNRTNEQFFEEDVAFFKYLNKEEKSLVLQGTANRLFVKGEQVNGKNGECSGVLIIRKGKLRAYMLSDEGREITLYYLEKDDICVMSASCVMSCIAFEVHIEAEDDTDVIQISAPIFASIVKDNLKVENFALRLAVDRFSDVMWAMQQLLFFSMDKRLAMYLYDEISKTKSLEISTTHEQIAKSLASAREVVTRLLQQFHKQGIVELSRGKISVIDRNKLSKLCN